MRGEIAGHLTMQNGRSLPFLNETKEHTMLTNSDYKDLKDSLGLIKHITELDERRPLIEWLKIIEFILAQSALIFFKDGKPKTYWQLAMSIPAILKFVKEIIRMIKGETEKRPKRSLEQKTVDAVEAGRLNAKPKSTDNK